MEQNAHQGLAGRRRQKADRLHLDLEAIDEWMPTTVHAHAGTREVAALC